jgi:hypothetical protein
MKKIISIQSARVVNDSPKARRLVKTFDAQVTLSALEFKTVEKFVEKCLEHVPQHIARALVDEYARRMNKAIDYDKIQQKKNKTASEITQAVISAENARTKSANIYLRNASRKIQSVVRRLPFENKAALLREEIAENEARLAAAHCLQVVQSLQGVTGDYGQKLLLALRECERFTTGRGVKIVINDINNHEAIEAALVRYVNDEWWIAKYARIRAEAREYINIVQGLVGKGRQEYASNQCVSEYRQQRASNEAYLALMDVIDEETQEAFCLKDIADKSTANPELRRVELMVRCRGLEELAEDLGYQAFFVTWTTPSKYHRNSDKWNGSKPSETQKYLCGQWAKCRAAIKRKNIDWFGVRVAEPHSDSTPHWHLLVFTAKSDAAIMRGIMSRYAFEHDADENGALKHRFTVEEIDTSKGSATGYIAKYIAKNINAENVQNEPDYDGSGSLSDAVLRVGSWASRWRVRQFQFFGAAAVSVYRECRRLKNSVECKALEAVRLAADSGKWAEFTKALQANPLKLVYGKETQNKYGENVKKITGLISLNSLFEALTRLKSFRLEKRRAAASSGGSRAPWSSVNNCTGSSGSLARLMKTVGISQDFLTLLERGARIVDRGRGFRLCNGQLIEFTP